MIGGVDEPPEDLGDENNKVESIRSSNNKVDSPVNNRSLNRTGQSKQFEMSRGSRGTRGKVEEPSQQMSKAKSNSNMILDQSMNSNKRSVGGKPKKTILRKFKLDERRIEALEPKVLLF